MDLEGQQPFQRAVGLVVVVQFRRDLAVDLVNEVIALGDDVIFLPFGHRHGDGVALGHEPLAGLRVGDDTLPVFGHNAPPPLVIEHAVVFRGRVDVALIAPHGPGAHLGKFLGAVLDAAVVLALDPHLGAQFKVLEQASSPDQELIVGQVVRGLRAPRQNPVLDCPKLGIPLPATEVLAVEEVDKAVLRAEAVRQGHPEADKPDEGIFHGHRMAEIRGGSTSEVA